MFDPDKWLNIEYLKKELNKNLLLKKNVDTEFVKYNFYGKKYIEV
jgi:hypothetical protein